MHYSYAQTPRRQVNVMELKAVFEFVSPKVREAAVKTAEQLTQLNIRHALAAGWLWAHMAMSGLQLM
jgi:hypothetical protein